MLQHKVGNLIDMAEQGNFDVIVHGCNCMNTMGAGIAKEIRERYPLAYEADILATKQWPEPVAKLGNFSYVEVGQPAKFLLVNAYTQLNFQPRGVDHFEYEAFYVILRKLEVLSNKSDVGFKFGFPYIGTGLAGGNKDRIVAMLESFAEKVSKNNGTVTLVEFG
jgi:O-acetyl-ADP-ribose deacetylase (regulator of RNase III)